MNTNRYWIQGRLQGLRTGVDSNWFGIIYMFVFIGSYRIAYRFLECSRVLSDTIQ